jgi:hypothetical protein
VDSTVTPLVEHGRTVGYVATRTRPDRFQVEEAEHLYTQMTSAASSQLTVTAEGLVGLVERFKT